MFHKVFSAIKVLPNILAGSVRISQRHRPHRPGGCRLACFFKFHRPTPPHPWSKSQSQPKAYSPHIWSVILIRYARYNKSQNTRQKSLSSWNFTLLFYQPSVCSAHEFHVEWFSSRSKPHLRVNKPSKKNFKKKEKEHRDSLSLSWQEIKETWINSRQPISSFSVFTPVRAR